MIFGKTYSERRKKIEEKKAKLKNKIEDFFAWFPVWLEDGRIVWLQTICRETKYIIWTNSIEAVHYYFLPEIEHAPKK